VNFEEKAHALIAKYDSGYDSSTALNALIAEALRSAFEAGAEQMKRRAAKICADSAAISYENDENTWGALAESYGERIRALSPEEPKS
jgi:hypothetical protein